ncbi:GDSL-like Lipase/Acylhydrolase [Sodiomyces alkalinus F11]|uniref:GDSL-like Lipase/Acylhydrolase n=1 Tax=Sodiomyces alkalinus (strain CBS 110278 / VKM F-3762 / F11) TaxID=1314773 RepID=A0A3N2PS55_SODAK|nr:GDSL-like Lipase/Acylhydrolase [Sodiomyces alkalinus F11]ROT37337.1 GDSL-like Lipase/Acylhydrolase [Sodiomyces alkalinus F11]
MPTPRRSLRILCFGDSLTAGYSHHGAVYHPYAEVLDEKLKAAFPNTDITILENGMPGDIVSTEAFIQRLESELDRPTFDWVIILGGTNDIGYGIEPETILSSLEEAFATCLFKGSKVLALTIPETHSKPGNLSARSRKQVNDGIMKQDTHGLYAFDLHAAIPYHSLSPQDKEKYWDDGLHLTPDGYDWMGRHIASALIKLIIQEVSATGATDRRSRRMLRYAQDELLFEEEMGDPRRLHEGYVVVRLKDLN